MKKLIIAAAMLAFGGTASAGEYHVGKYLLCYDCHSMHASQQHGFQNGTVGVGSAGAALYGDWQFAQGTGYEYLLKGAHSEACIACHDNKAFAPDVMGDNANAYARSAGSIADGSTNHEAFKGHDLDTVKTAPGGASQTLTCFGCHIQHGLAQGYRNLGSRSDATVTPTYAVVDGAAPGVVTDLTKDVTIKVLAAALDTTGATPKYIPQVDGAFGGYYTMGNVSYAASAMTNRMNNMCAKCHSQFHSLPGAGGAATGVGGVAAATSGFEQFTRHPTNGVQLGGVVPGGGWTSRDGLQLKAGTKVKAAQKNAGDFIEATPMCISCHNAHGSTNAFGLRYLAASVTLSDPAQIENGTGRYANLCNNCHRQGTAIREDYTGFPGAASVQ